MATTRSLYLVRHAIAAARGDKWPDDAQRPLTHEGADRRRQAARGLASLKGEIDLVTTSPLVRAAATADILVRALPSRPRLVASSALAPGGSPPVVADALGS